MDSPGINNDTDKSPACESPGGSESREKRYNKVKLRISIADMILNLALLALLAFSGLAPAIVDVIESVFRNEYLLFLLFLAASGALFSFFGMPLDFYSGFVLEHRYGLSNQTFGKWMWEKIKAMIVGLVIGLPVALIFYYFLKAAGWLWWMYFSIFIFFVSVFLARIAPVIIFPLFYKFKELESEEVKEKIMSLLNDQGINITGIFSFDMSKDTKKANAGFTGIGKSKRIILSDTLLEKFTADEIAVIFAHEMGHYKKKHILKNIALSTVIIFASFFLCGQAYEVTLAAAGYRHVHELPALPILFLYLSIFSLILMPVTNYISRHYERQADAYALDTSGDMQSFISSMEKLSEINLADRDPHPVTEFMFYSHPSIKRRVEFARNYSKQ